MLMYRNAEGVHGQRKFGNPWSSTYFTIYNILNMQRYAQCCHRLLVKNH